MKLLFDENVPEIVVSWFRELHIDLKTAQDLSLRQTPDREVIRKANTLHRTLVTYDKDMISLQLQTKMGSF